MQDITQRSATLFFVAWNVSWFFVGCLRIPRYIRYFQGNDYDATQYWSWFWHDIAELRYKVLTFGFFILGILAIAISIGLNVLFVENIGALLSGIIFAVLALFAYYLAPRDRAIKSLFKPTPRAIRLLLTAYMVEAVPVLIAGFVFWLFFDGYIQEGGEVPYGCIIFFMWGLPTLAIASFAGPLSYFLTPYSLPIANMINWPIDAVLSKSRRQR